MLMTCGPWRAVRLETYQARVDDLRVIYEMDTSLKKVSGTIIATVEGCSGQVVHFTAKKGDHEVFKAAADLDSEGCAQVEFHINNPKLWYPHGYGEQILYTVTATLKNGHEDLHSLSKRTGFRQGELVQEPDDIGKTFFFRINGIDVFCGGSNWIPADSFTPRVTADKYRKWLQMMVDGYQTMIRVWGGGIYEEDVFYDLCDELGILVWQDFMFACGNYPAFLWTLASIEDECVCQTKRLRHHPSLMVYAYVTDTRHLRVAERLMTELGAITRTTRCRSSINLPMTTKTKTHRTGWRPTFLLDISMKRYEFPKVPDHGLCSCTISYYRMWWRNNLRTSPIILARRGATDPTVGDLHQWNVWHGTQEKYQIFDTLGGRFNSEFGMEAFPHIDTIKYYVTDPSQLYPQSHMIDFHNKADGHERRIATYVVENFRMRTELEKFIHLTQLSQADALMFGYRGWRQRWGQKRLCGGALVWQLNDCWPVTSWAIVDYFLRKKPAYYAMRRVLAPVAVAVKRAHHDWSVVHARPAPTSDYECWAVSSRMQEVATTVELRYISIATGHDIKDKVTKKDITITPNGTTKILKGTIDNEKEEPHVLAARIWVQGELVSRDVDWPQPLKYLDFNDRDVEVTLSGDSMRVKAGKPTKGLVFEEREGVLLNDSALDVVPGDEQTITVKGLGMRDKALGWTYLGAP